MSLRANWLTLSRVLLALLFPLTFRTGETPALLWSLLLLALMGLSDLLDGRFARRHLARTGEAPVRAGELIDSVADGFARLTALLVFLDAGLLPVWMVLLMVWRDLVSWALRFMDLGLGRSEVHKRLSGKVNGAVQSAAVGGVVLVLLLAAGLGREPMAWLVWGLGGLAAATALWSTLDLLYAYRGTLRRFTGLMRAAPGESA